MRRYSPYAYGFDNPIRFIDHDGMGPNDVIVKGPEAQAAFAQLQKSVAGQVNLSMDASGKLSSAIAGVTANADATKLTTAINDHSVVVNVNTTSGNYTPEGNLMVGGAFGGNTVPASPSGLVTTAEQYVNPSVLSKADAPYGQPGENTLHEVTEAYAGAKISQSAGVSSGNSSAPGSVYQEAHNSAAPQAGPITQAVYDSFGNVMRPTNLIEGTRLE